MINKRLPTAREGVEKKGPCRCGYQESCLTAERAVIQDHYNPLRGRGLPLHRTTMRVCERGLPTRSR